MDERFYRNTRFLCRKRGVRMSELESLGGVSAGYIGRAAKRGSIRLDIAYKTALRLGVSLDDMLSRDYKLEAKRRGLEAELKKINRMMEGLGSDKD